MGSTTGLLVKLLDARERLPVHCHPTRQFARDVLGSPFGKAEAWIVVATRQVPGAEPPNVRVGFGSRPHTRGARGPRDPPGSSGTASKHGFDPSPRRLALSREARGVPRDRRRSVPGRAPGADRLLDPRRVERLPDRARRCAPWARPGMSCWTSSIAGAMTEKRLADLYGAARAEDRSSRTVDELAPLHRRAVRTSTPCAWRRAVPRRGRSLERIPSRS